MPGDTSTLAADLRLCGRHVLEHYPAFIVVHHLEELKVALEQGEVALPDDEDLMADLSAITYSFDQRGRIRLEGKDEVRKRLGRSPDRADAVALALGKVGSRYLGPWRVQRVPI